MTIDNRRATQEMTEYLLGLGHQAHCLPDRPVPASRQALCVPKGTCRRWPHGLSTRDALVLESDFTLESGQQLASDLLDLPVPPTAIFGSNDMVTLGCLRRTQAARDIGSRADQPGGFRRDIAATQMVDPALTTVRVPMRDLGTMGVRQL